MSVGETLARARRDAGLSIADISIRTRITQSAIEGIEHDDYSACGGDSGARGAIAALAQALRIDSVPLVRAYDAAGEPGQWIDAATPSEPAFAAQAAEADTPPEPYPYPSATERLRSAPQPFPPAPEPSPPAPEPFPPAPEPGSATASEDTQPIPMGLPPGPVIAGEPAGPVPTGGPPPVTPGGSPYPVTPAGPSWLDWRGYADRPQRMWIALGAGLLAVAILGGILLALGISSEARPPVAGSGRNSGAAGPARTQQPSAGHSTNSPGSSRQASPASSPPVRALVPASIAAFGPGGTSHGDSPQLANQALAGKPASPWHSSWYTTPHFGNLQNGTGLLLNMGRTVTITSARIALGSRPGADLTLRIGNSPTLASMRPVAYAHHAGGVVRLTTAAARGRYVLVWFTKLPPDPAGTFQVSVYTIRLRGYP